MAKKTKKLPVVVEKHIVIINGRTKVLKSCSWTESVGEAITDGWLGNTQSEILEYVKENI